MKEFRLTYGQLVELDKQIEQHLENELQRVDLTKKLDIHDLGNPIACICNSFISDAANEHYKSERETHSEIETRIKAEILNKLKSYLGEQTP